jgi:hypothetical protein
LRTRSLLTGLPRLDAAIGGLVPGDVYVVWDPTGYVGAGLTEAFVHAVTRHQDESVLLFSSMPLGCRRPHLDPDFEREVLGKPTPLASEPRLFWADLEPAVSGPVRTCQAHQELTARVESLDTVPSLIILDDLNAVLGQRGAASGCASWAVRFDRPVVIVAVGEVATGQDNWHATGQAVPADLEAIANAVIMVALAQPSAADAVGEAIDEDGRKAQPAELGVCGSENWELEVQVGAQSVHERVPVIFDGVLFCRQQGSGIRCPHDCGMVRQL